MCNDKILLHKLKCLPNNYHCIMLQLGGIRLKDIRESAFILHFS